jgi:PatG Domain
MEPTERAACFPLQLDGVTQVKSDPMGPAHLSSSSHSGCSECEEESQPNLGDRRSLSYVYALGRVEPRFPRLSIEKEFAQVTGRSDTAGLTDRQTVHAVLSKRENRYLVRQLCYVFSIEGIDTYLLQPRDPADYELLSDAIRPTPRSSDIDVVIGLRGQISTPGMCNGLLLPTVGFDQIYSFDIDSLIKSIPRPEKTSSKAFEATAEELFLRIQQLADNAGSADEHRAVNYLVVRYKDIYSATADAYARNCSLTAIETRRSRLSGVRTVIDVIFCYTNRATDVTEKLFARVDVTEQFPYLATKLSPYYDR